MLIDIPDLINQTRAEMSYQEFSDSLKAENVIISSRSLCHWETGKHFPNIRTIKLLAAVGKGKSKIFCQNIIKIMESNK